MEPIIKHFSKKLPRVILTNPHWKSRTGNMFSPLRSRHHFSSSSSSEFDNRFFRSNHRFSAVFSSSSSSRFDNRFFRSNHRFSAVPTSDAIIRAECYRKSLFWFGLGLGLGLVAPMIRQLEQRDRERDQQYPESAFSFTYDYQIKRREDEYAFVNWLKAMG